MMISIMQFNWMTFLLHEGLRFIASFLVGAVFLDVFLTMYERHRSDLVQRDRRIFRWSLKGGIGIAVIAVLLELLFSR